MKQVNREPIRKVNREAIRQRLLLQRRLITATLTPTVLIIIPDIMGIIRHLDLDMATATDGVPGSMGASGGDSDRTSRFQVFRSQVRVGASKPLPSFGGSGF